MIEYQLKLIGKKYFDIFDVEGWYDKWEMTEEQSSQFREYAIPLIKGVFKCNKKKAIVTFEWFWKEFGLKVKQS